MTGTAEVVDFTRAIPLWVDVLAVSVGAASGSLTAVARRYDLSGIIAIGIATGLGGGIARDVLLQRGTPVALTEPALLLAAVVVSLAVFALIGSMDNMTKRIRALLVPLDTAVLGIFTIVGAAKGLEAGLPALSCVLLGVITGVGGGVLRDVLTRQEPEMLQPGTMYALAGTAGAIVYVLVVPVGEHQRWVGVGCIAFIVALRTLAVRHHWSSPEPPDLRSRGRRLSQRQMPDEAGG